jgi:hypothetical protein
MIVKLCGPARLWIRMPSKKRRCYLVKITFGIGCLTLIRTKMAIHFRGGIFSLSQLARAVRATLDCEKTNKRREPTEITVSTATRK